MSSPRKTPTARRSLRPRDKVRTVILDAAEAEFVAHGPAAVSTREIAARAGVQQSLIFRHFGTKADLVVAVYRRHTQHFFEKIEESELPLEQLLAQFLDDRSFWRLITRVALDGGGPGTPRWNQIRGLQDLVGRFERAQLEGRVDKGVSAEHLMALQFALTVGLVVLEPTLARVLSASGRAGRGLRQELLTDWLALLRPQQASRSARHRSR